MTTRLTLDILGQVKSAIRSGKYTDLGGYPLALVMADGECLCIECASAEWRNICHSTLHGIRDGWNAAGASVNYENPDLYCAHCSARIESAYAEPDDLALT